MGNPSTVNRIFMVKAGMTPQDVINSKEATAQQKKMAYVFDSDDVTGYSQREADVFNATLITDRGQNGVSLWTRYKDGSKKETKYTGDIAAFKFAPEGDVKPYTQKIVTKKSAQNAQDAINEAKLIDKLSMEGKGELKVETYENGQVKKKEYNDKETNKIIEVSYYEDGTHKSLIEKCWYEVSAFSLTGSSHHVDTKKVEYYPNGKLKSSYTYDMKTRKKVNKEFYEDGTPKSLIEQCWHEISVFSLTGSPHYEKTKEVYYDNKGNVVDKAKVVK